MKISFNWLNELIQTHKSPHETAEILTGTGLEVESITPYESIPGGLEGVVVGEVLTCVKHPNADKLSLTTVNVGNYILPIVCGAPNVAIGQKVLVATVGAVLYPNKGEPFKINKSKIRGEVSEGMICAEDEIGLGQSHDGILVLPNHYEIGKPASFYFKNYTDYLIEIGLTANRGDAASHLGVARDLKAVTGIPINKPVSNLSTTHDSSIQISIEDIECPRYSGISIEGITVKNSPEWLQNKLKVIGLHPINNVVDATNYVLHELGQPLHAFDADHISGKSLIIKKVKPGTLFVTLDKVERTLNGSELMICDQEKPLAIAGVFGGLKAGVTQATKNIFIESAYFDATSIRKTAKLHGLNTDASFRYERGTDPNITVKALQRVAQLIIEIADGNSCSSIKDIYPAPIEPTSIHFSIAKFHQIIGQSIPENEIKNILNQLEIDILSDEKGMLQLSIPTYRSDITREIDVTEEILRIYGLNNIQIPTQVKSSISPSLDEKNYALRNKVADYLSNIGFHELTNNSLTKSSYYTEAELTSSVALLNPLSNDLNIMRMDMIYSSLEVMQYNINRKENNMNCFEFGKTYQLMDGKFTEQQHLLLTMVGNKQGESWFQPQQATGFFTIKTMVTNLLKRIGIAHQLSFEMAATNDRFEQAITIAYNGTPIALFGEVSTKITRKFDLTQPVFAADLIWDSIHPIALTADLKFKPLSPFPQVRRDLALILDDTIQYQDIEKIAVQKNSNLLQSIQVFDVYQDDRLGKNKKSYGISFILQDSNKTLTDQEIDTYMNQLIKQFEKELGATLRS